MGLLERLILWLYHKIAPNGTTWLILVCLITISVHSITQASWVPDSSPITGSLLVGLVIGIMVAKSHFLGKYAAGYHFLLSFLFLWIWTGKIIPALDLVVNHPVQMTLDLMNVRMLTMIDRVSNWGVTLADGNNIQDTDLFVLWVGLLGWFSAAWLVWAVVRRRQALLGIIPMGLMLAINIDQSQQPVEYLWLFIGLAFLLVGRTAMVNRYRSWDIRQVDYPDELSWSWTGYAIGLCTLVLLLARVAPLIGTPEGWKTLSDVFLRAEQRVESTTNRLFGSVAPPRKNPDPNDVEEQYVISAETPQMALIGKMPALIDTEIMWVRTSDPPPPEPVPGVAVEITDLPQAHYWRSAVFGEYTGVGWERLPLTDDAYGLIVINEPISQGRTSLTQEFQIVARHGTDLFAANQVEAVGGVSDHIPDQVRLSYVVPDGTPLVVGQGSNYTVHSWIPSQVSDVELQAAPEIYPLPIKTTYLQLPAGLPQRVRDLATRVVGESATSYDKAVRIQDYLRLSYPYRLDVPLPPTGRDVVDYFLYDAPGGFCTYYATAMTVMLRSQGVASRVISGYATGIYDFERGAYRVTPANAHAWVEVYFPGYGWIEFEPTAALPRINYDSATGQNQVISQLIPPRPDSSPVGWKITLTISAFLMISILLMGFVLINRTMIGSILGSGLTARASPDLQAQALYSEFRHLLGWAGLSMPASVTPDEFLRESSPLLQDFSSLRTALEYSTGLYCQSVYSPRSPSSEGIISARQSVIHGWREYATLLVRRFWKIVTINRDRTKPRTVR